MFDIVGNDIAELKDADLRTLVARLAIAELNRQQLPISGVTAGGNQDAPDGGIDVRVEAQDLPAPDFVPRRITGFQVKKPNLPIFETRDHEDAVGLSSKFLELMEHAPDRAMFLGDLRSRIFPSGWSGSLADILERRRTMLEPLASHRDPVVRTWIGSLDAWLTERIAEERRRDAEREETFE